MPEDAPRQSQTASQDDERKGPIAWFSRHPVAANLLMVIFLIGGLINAFQIEQEVFPSVTPDIITVSVPYPGAGPEEVEEGVVIPIEGAVRGIDGVKQVRSSSGEGRGTVLVELLSGTDRQTALNDVKNEVDRITSFPQEVEEPIISLPDNNVHVISLMLFGDLSRRTLYQLSEDLRREMLNDTKVTQIDIRGLPPPEISIEIPQENLRRFGLTPPQLARRIDASSLELPSGSLETRGGELRLRVTEKREYGPAFAEAAIIKLPDGSTATLADMGAVIDTFQDTDERAYFEGQPAAQLQIYRVADQTPVGIANAVKDFVAEKRKELPDRVRLATWNDRSQLYENRVGLLLENAAIGVMLVLVILGIFLRPRLAFWVTLGIPISFLGAFLVLPGLDASINMISLFAFLLVLGIVVDDAIVIGEAVHRRQMLGEEGAAGAISGTRELAVPVIFAVATTMIAFSPLLFVPGVVGQFFETIPRIVLPILVISLVESLLILPAHLSHKDQVKKGERKGWLEKASRIQERFSDSFDHCVERWVPGLVDRVLRFRYLTIAGAIFLLALAAGYVLGGRIEFAFLPKIEGDEISATVEMTFGTSEERTQAVMERLVEAAQEVVEENGGAAINEGIFAYLGQTGVTGGVDPVDFGETQAGSHLATVSIFLSPASERTIGSQAFTRQWRARVGQVAGVERLNFSFEAGPPTGAAISLQLAHEDRDNLRQGARRLAESLGGYAGVFDIDDGFTQGKEQIDFTLRPSARALGLTETDLALQLRGAVFGAEAERQQRRRDELRVYVRLPDAETRSEYLVENLVVRTPQGGEIPLEEAAFFERTFSDTSIERRDGRRVVAVTADVDPAITSGNTITSAVLENVLPEIQADFPGLEYFLAGEQEAQTEALQSLGRGMAIALLVMFATMAVIFNSYVQPLIIMVAIPFGFVGALVGHLLMGFNLSLISVFGLVALSGVVVNDSLVLTAAVNDRRRKSGMDLDEALRDAAVRRFRPVLLTSLTTFFGLAPMIFETAVQARFLIPMALSLGFGILFVTPIAILLVPCLYHVLEDIKNASRSR